MGLPRNRQVNDLLHQIADLVEQADVYLVESSLSPIAFCKTGKSGPRPPLSPLAFAKTGKKPDKQGIFLSLQVRTKPLKPRASGLEPHRVDRVTNRLRNLNDKIDKPVRNKLRARRERAQRSRYHSYKGVSSTPRKLLGTKFRTR